jgi:membrane-associated phospholipid phosphatase
MPFLKGFIIPYTTAYALWVVAPFWVYGCLGRKKFYEFICVSFVCNILSIMIFILIPNGIYADFRPIITDDQAKHDFFLKVCKWTFDTDSFDQAFPSGHWTLCVVLCIAFRGTYFKKNNYIFISLAAWFVMIFSIVICLSTLFVHQHYIFDGISSIIMCEIIYLIFKWWKVVPNFLDNKMYWFNCRLGLVNDKQIPQYKTKDKRWILLFIIYLIWVGLTCAAFWETQWFLSEFAINMAAMGIWLIGVFIYYMFKKPKKIKVDVYQKNIARN